MPDQIDPGPGWRLLKCIEKIAEGDEYRFGGKWVKSTRIGLHQICGAPYRRLIPTLIPVKGIATRATVRMKFASATTEASISSENGLTPEMIGIVAERWEFAKTNRSAKYVMLEIQRGENDF